MARHYQSVWLFLISVIAVGAFLLPGFNTRSQNANRSRGPFNQAKDVDTSTFPIVDYSATTLNPQERAKHEARVKKYKSKRGLKLEYADSVHVVNHSLGSLSALPVDKSSVVIIGEVDASKAYLSEDRTTVYSEYTVTVELVLKNDTSREINANSSVVIERYGGKVRLPSGKIVVAQVDYEGMPRVGSKYLFFLKTQQDETYSILTGYELRMGKVFPLDETLPSHPIHAYKQRDEATLISDLMSVLPASPSMGRK